jgi:1-acyl-sn-glycerol-3-phosphate acyltransferase
MYGKRIHFPKLLPRKTLHVVAGDPVPLDDLREEPLTAAVLAEATERILASLTALVAELRAEQPPVQRYDPRRSAPGRQP